ncbi:TIGR03118 family protein [Lysobacter niastensis]|uniref:TIGR03118 family protein n=1 Tax=Lysobacter niastensis TaxID=380629 RepID=A0ABS0BAV9_9GAMM|nr:TIGR03118 family protein [Lysobacter niastensis]MBF6024164.1 TIGR03118 family protein [Lysobacter niastensis]
MKSPASLRTHFFAPLALAFALTLAAAPAVQAADGFRFEQRNLVSDGFIPAEHTDPNLVNSWGIAFNPFGFVWVADADAGVSTLYDGDGNANALVVAIPSPGDPSGGGEPTGIVFNASNFFTVTNGTATGASRFIFATEQGVIAGWAPNVDVTHAITAIDNSASGANYKGLALSAGGNGQLLYAADFFHARVDVFDSTFKPVQMPAGAFKDPRIPAGFAPFGIHAIGGNIYVTYAKQDAAMTDEVVGPGLGYVDVYTPNGQLIRRIASRGSLNAPWGVALAPAKFGFFSNALLIGNFGDGRINAYEPVFGFALGPLRDKHFQPIEIEGLWGIGFGNGFLNQPVNTLFFASGPDDEEHGLYGRLDVIP